LRARIIGRRHTLSHSNKKILRQINNDYRGNIEVVTYDYLIDTLRKYPKSLFDLTINDPKIFSAFSSNVKENPEEYKRLKMAIMCGFDYELYKNEEKN